jgi:large subunit ribosomal protein L33
MSGEPARMPATTAQGPPSVQSRAPFSNLPTAKVRGTSSPAMRDNIRLVSSANTGFTYYTTKNKRKQQGKLELKKYDPVVRQHVVFKETKMPPHSK